MLLRLSLKISVVICRLLMTRHRFLRVAPSLGVQQALTLRSSAFLQPSTCLLLSEQPILQQPPSCYLKELFPAQHLDLTCGCAFYFGHTGSRCILFLAILRLIFVSLLFQGILIALVCINDGHNSSRPWPFLTGRCRIRAIAALSAWGRLRLQRADGQDGEGPCIISQALHLTKGSNTPV
jgi:hypothetical protein